MASDSIRSHLSLRLYIYCMKLKVRLLPHWCQIVGYAYLLVYFIVCMIVMLISAIAPYSELYSLVSQALSPLMRNYEIMSIVNMSMMILAALSKDRVEDELMMALRLRSIVSIVFLPFVFQIAAFLLPDHLAANKFVTEVILSDLLTDFGILFLLYLIIFKSSVIINRWISRLAD